MIAWLHTEAALQPPPRCDHRQKEANHKLHDCHDTSQVWCAWASVRCDVLIQRRRLFRGHSGMIHGRVYHPNEGAWRCPQMRWTVSSRLNCSWQKINWSWRCWWFFTQPVRSQTMLKMSAGLWSQPTEMNQTGITYLWTEAAEQLRRSSYSVTLTLRFPSSEVWTWTDGWRLCILPRCSHKHADVCK